MLELSAAGAGGNVSASGLAAGLEPGLSRQRVRIQRTRLGVLLRRHATLALAAAIVLEALALIGVVPQLLVVVVPLVLLAATVAWALRRRLSLPAVAQLLDERLRLFDRLGTALELERRGAGNGGGSPLERRTVAEAAALVEGGAGQWRARPVAAPREWAAAGAALAVLVALVVVAIAPGAGSDAGDSQGQTALGAGEGPGAEGKGARNKKALEHYLGGPSTPNPSLHRQIAPGEQIRPAAGYRQPGKAAGHRGAEVHIDEQQANPTHVQYGFRFKDQSIGDAAYEAQPGAPKARDRGSDGHAVAGAGKGAAKGGEAKGGNAQANGGEGNGPGAGGGKKGAGQGEAKAPPGAPTGAAGAKPGAQLAAPASKAAAGAKGQSARGAPGATPGGGATAGNGAGGNRTGESLGFKGTESQALKLQSGYAPFHSGKAKATGGRAGERQGGGGKSRSAEVEGSANFGTGGGEFAFVPATGGATAAAGGSQLAQSYSAALRWLEQLPW